MGTQHQKVWLITGTSKGLGLKLTKLLLSKGHRVIATTRNIDALEMEITSYKENLLPVKLDITSDTQVKGIIEESIEKLGGIYVVVNNAGYCLVGSMEEMSDEEFRATMDVNLFGTVNIIRNVTPYLRKQKSGHIINISSISGYSGNPEAASYNAAKFGVTEGFAQEIAEFGIKATVVAPGQFRIDFMDSLQFVNNRIDVYGTDQAEKLWVNLSGQQKGDPDKLAKIILSISQMENPPLHLLVGSDTYEPIVKKREAELKEMNKWRSMTVSTDFS